MGFQFTDAERVNKLPAWAAGEVGRLERELKRCHKLLTEAPEGANVWADPYSDTPRPVGKDVTVRFGDPEDHRATKYEVKFQDGELIVTAFAPLSMEMVILPRVSNGVNISARKRS